MSYLPGIGCAFLRGACCASNKLADRLAKGRSFKQRDPSTIHPQQGGLVHVRVTDVDTPLQDIELMPQNQNFGLPKKETPLQSLTAILFRFGCRRYSGGDNWRQELDQLRSLMATMRQIIV